MVDLAKAVGRPEAKGRILDAVRAKHNSCEDWLTGVMLALGVPAVDLIMGAPRSAPVIEPEAKSVETFTSLTADDLREERLK